MMTLIDGNNKTTIRMAVDGRVAQLLPSLNPPAPTSCLASSHSISSSDSIYFPHLGPPVSLQFSHGALPISSPKTLTTGAGTVMNHTPNGN